DEGDDQRGVYAAVVGVLGGHFRGGLRGRFSGGRRRCPGRRRWRGLGQLRARGRVRRVRVVLGGDLDVPVDLPVAVVEQDPEVDHRLVRQLSHPDLVLGGGVDLQFVAGEGVAVLV